jgi:hypothetical protein
VRANPGRRVLLAAETLGSEDLIASVCAATGLRAYAPPGCGPAALAACGGRGGGGSGGSGSGGSGGSGRSGSGSGHSGGSGGSSGGASGDLGSSGRSSRELCTPADAALTPGSCSSGGPPPLPPLPLPATQATPCCPCCYRTEALHLQRVEELQLLLGDSGCLTDDPSARLWLIGGRGMPWLGHAVSGNGAILASFGDSGGGSGGDDGGAAAVRGGPLPLWERPAPLIIRVSAMASSLRAAELAAEAPRGAPRAHVAVEGFTQGCVEFVAWARHSSGPELRAALQVGRRAARGREGLLGAPRPARSCLYMGVHCGTCGRPHACACVPNPLRCCSRARSSPLSAASTSCAASGRG